MATHYLPITWTWNREKNTQEGRVTIQEMPSFWGEVANTLDATWGSMSGSFTPIHFYKGSGQNEDSTGARDWGLDYAVDNEVRYQEFNYTLWWEHVNNFSYNMNDIKVTPKMGSYLVKCIDYNKFTGPNKVGEVSTHWDMSATVGFNVNSVLVAQPVNIKQSQSAIYKDIDVSFAIPQGNIFDYQIKEGDVVRQQATNVTGNKVTIKAGTLKGTSAVIYITSKLNFLGTTYAAEPIEYKLTLEALEAAMIDNFRVVGADHAMEEIIPFEWELLNTIDGATNTCYIEFWQEGKKIYADNTTSTVYKLPPSIIKVLTPLTVRYKNVTRCSGYSVETPVQSITVNNIVSITPVVTHFTLDGYNRDEPISVMIGATHAERYELYRDNTKIAEGMTNTLVIPQGRLLNGANTVKVIAYRTAAAGTLRGELVKQVDIIQDNPLIYAVEPSNINVNVDELSNVSFSTNSFINRWELFINGSFFIAGNEERQVQMAGHTFTKGINRLKVVAYYSPPYNIQEVRQITKEVTFNGYGKPQRPVLDANTTYATATPTFTWSTGVIESDTQTAFDIEVHTEAKTVNSQACTYTVQEPLQNNQTYLVRLRVKNKFELWSDWTEKEINTLFTELPKPVVTLSPQKENVLIMIACEHPSTFKNLSIFRSINNKDWIEIANDLNATDSLIDFLAPSNTDVFYKARLYDTAGGYNDSEIKSISTRLMNYNLLNVLDLKSNKQLDFVAVNFVNNFTSITKLFAGASKPIFYKGKSSFLTGNMTVKVINEEVDALITYLIDGEIFCYRDYKGKKIFVAIDLTAINYINPFMQELVLNLTEVNFNEYLAGNKSNYTRFIYLDGEYFLDGSIDLSSWGTDLS